VKLQAGWDFSGGKGSFAGIDCSKKETNPDSLHKVWGNYGGRNGVLRVVWRPTAAAMATAAPSSGLASNIAAMLSYFTLTSAIIFLVVESYNRNLSVRTKRFRLVPAISA
jgi:hypothetical protein